jgi:nucleolar protein 4
LILRNLHFYCTEAHLRKATKSVGELVQVSIPMSEDGKTKGFGFIEFKTQEEGENAIKNLSGTLIQGRPISFEWAVPKKEYKKEDEASDEKAILDETLITEEARAEAEAIGNNKEEQQSETDSNVEEMHDDNEALEEDDSEPENESNPDADENTVTEMTPEVTYEKKQKGLLEGMTLFIRNLSFDTTQDTLHKS